MSMFLLAAGVGMGAGGDNVTIYTADGSYTIAVAGRTNFAGTILFGGKSTPFTITDLSVFDDDGLIHIEIAAASQVTVANLNVAGLGVNDDGTIAFDDFSWAGAQSSEAGGPVVTITWDEDSGTSGNDLLGIGIMSS